MTVDSFQYVQDPRGVQSPLRANTLWVERGRYMKHLKTLGEYVGHLAIGAAMFAALLLFGGTLNRLVHWFGPVIGDESFTD